jgi:hypothetical protein
MSVIREYRDENDPKNRNVNQEIPDIPEPPPVENEAPPEPATEPDAIPSTPEVESFPEQPFSNQEQPVEAPSEQVGSVPPQTYESQKYPIRPGEFVPITPGQSIQPSMTDMRQQYQPDEVIQNELERANTAFQNNSLTGATYPGFYEVGETRERLYNMTEANYQFLFNPPEQVERDLVQGNYEDAEWAEQQMERLQRLGEAPSLDSSRDIRERGTVGWVGNYGQEWVENVLGGGEFEDLPQGYVNPQTGREFAPFRGFRKVARDLKEAPLRTLGAMITTPGTPFLAGSQWGDYGGGTAGFLIYALDSIGRTTTAITTDVIRMSNGDFGEDEDSALLQSFLGRDYNFSSPQDHNRRTAPPGEEVRNDKPLSTLSTSAQTPETWQDLQDRSWVWAWTAPFKGELPDFMQTKRGAQVAEFSTGLALDILLGGKFDALAERGGRAARNLISPPKLPDNLPNARRVDEATRQFNEDLEADLWDDTVTRRADDPAIAPREVDTPTGTYKVTGDESTPHLFEMKPGRIEDDIHKVIVQDEIPIRSASQPSNLPGQFAPIRNASEIEPPKYSFPSLKVSEDGTTRLLSPLNDLNLDPNIPEVLDPTALQNFRRSNSELTGLGISKGVIPPSRLEEPLSTLRINHLNDNFDGLFSRYGEDLSSVKFDVPADVDERALRAADSLADNVVNSPRIKSDTVRWQRANLPRELHGTTDETLDAVSDLAARSQIYKNLAEEHSELLAKFTQEKRLVTQIMKRVEEMPDVGRRTLLENPPSVNKYTTPLNVYDETFEALNPKLADEINQLDFFHGSKADVDLTSINPVIGAARSELGSGIHFSSDSGIALEYAGAQTTRNLPSVPTRKINRQGKLYTVKPRVRNPIDANAPLTQEIKDQVARAVNNTDLPSVAKTQLKRRLGSAKETYEKFMRDADEILEKFYVAEGMDFPEAEALNLQRGITANLRDNLNIDSVFYKGKVGDKEVSQLTLFGAADRNNIDVSEIVDVNQPFDALTQATYRNNADATSAMLFPKSQYAKTNSAESKTNMMMQALNRTSEQVDDTGRALEAATQDMMDQHYKVLDDVRAEGGTRQAQKEAQWRKQNETQIQHWNSPEDGIC